MYRYPVCLWLVVLLASGCNDGDADGRTSGELAWEATSNPSSGGDQGQALAVAEEALLIAGIDETAGDKGLRIEKRRLADGTLIPGFGQGGAVSFNPGTNRDIAHDIAVWQDAVYLLATEMVTPPFDTRWRLEKRRLDDGTLVSGFGSGGVITVDPTTNDDPPHLMVFDDESIYIGGVDLGGGLWQWRLEKRDLDDGALVDDFGVAGVLTLDFHGDNDTLRGLAIDGDQLYLAGDENLNGPDSRWRIEKRNATTALPDVTFGQNGFVTSNPGPEGEGVFGLLLTADHFLVWGWDKVPGDRRWRLEKRRRSDGGLDSGFASGGVLAQDFSKGDEALYSVARSGPYLYLAGEDHSGSSPAARVEKRLVTDGSLVRSFGEDGVLLLDPTAGRDTFLDSQVDGRYLYLVGYRDAAGGSGDRELWIQKRVR